MIEKLPKVVKRVTLRGRRLELVPVEHGPKRVEDGVRVVDAGGRAAEVRDQHVLDQALLVEQLLRGVQRHQRRRAVRAGAGVVDDRADPHRPRPAAGEDPDDVTLARVQLVGGVLAEEDDSGLELGKGDRAPVGQPDVAEAVETVRVAGEEGDARLRLAGARRHHRDPLDDRRRDPVDDA
jgi:hypothetical protein